MLRLMIVIILLKKRDTILGEKNDDFLCFCFTILLFLFHRFFDDEVCTLNNSNTLDVGVNSNDLLNTPTAPRTPESTTVSR